MFAAAVLCCTRTRCWHTQKSAVSDGDGFSEGEVAQYNTAIVAAYTDTDGETTVTDPPQLSSPFSRLFFFHTLWLVLKYFMTTPKTIENKVYGIKCRITE